MGDKFQRFLLILRKSGILRYGTTSYKYTSGRDMPAQAILDDVYDEQKDLLTKEDFKKISRVKSDKKPLTIRYCTQCGQKISTDTRLCSDCSEPGVK